MITRSLYYNSNKQRAWQEVVSSLRWGAVDLVTYYLLGPHGDMDSDDIDLDYIPLERVYWEQIERHGEEKV